jgi:ubiquitin-activating enzyme E1
LKEENGVVTCLEDHRHGLEDGDYVTFEEVKGMTELNGAEPRRVTVTGMFFFKLMLEKRKAYDILRSFQFQNW